MESERTKNLLYSCAAHFETQPGIFPDVSQGGSQAEPPNMSLDVPQGVSGFLAWLMLWIRFCVLRSHCCSRPFPTCPSEPNRSRRRIRRHFSGRNITPVRNNRPYFSFGRRGLSPTQFMERLVQLSGRGRVSVYRIRYWRKTVKGKAAPLGTGHEYWRDPLGRIGMRMGKLLCGVWYAHLWPGWQLLFPN